MPTLLHPSATHSLTPDSEVLRELILLHAKVLQRLAIVFIGLALGMVAVVFGKVPNDLLAGWITMTVAVECLRSLYGRWLLADPSRISVRRDHACMTALAALAGTTTTMMSFMFFPYLDVLDQAILGSAVFVIPATVVAVSLSSRYIVAAYAFTLVLPSCIMWAFMHPAHQLFTIGGGIVYASLLTVVAVESEKVLKRSLQIRIERDQVARALQASNDKVRAAMLRAEQSADARARVLAAASHDLRQPLHALSIYSAVLAEKPTQDTLREVGQSIHQIVRSLGSLLNGLLDLSKLSVGNYEVDRQVLALDRLVAEVCTEFHTAAKERGLNFSQSLTPLWVRTDANAVARIARVLIDNAIKYTDSGTVAVTVAVIGELAVIVVSDSGKGIAADEQSRVFEEFYQVDNVGRDRNKGVGLGLAITQRLCDLTGCTIALESQLGQGSRFTVSVGQSLAAPALGGVASLGPSPAKSGLRPS